MNRMVMREHLFLPFPSKSQIFVLLKLEGMGGNGFWFNENFVKTPKIPLQSQPFLHITKPFFFSQPVVQNNVAIILALLLTLLLLFFATTIVLFTVLLLFCEFFFYELPH